MTTSDVLAVVAATVVVMLVAVLATVIVSMTRTMRDLRRTLATLQRDAVDLLDEAEATVRDAAREMDRVDRLLSSAERLDDAKRTIATPVVKAMAFGTGVSRAAQRLREGEPDPKARPSRRRSAS